MWLASQIQMIWARLFLNGFIQTQNMSLELKFSILQKLPVTMEENVGGQL